MKRQDIESLKEACMNAGVDKKIGIVQLEEQPRSLSRWYIMAPQ